MGCLIVIVGMLYILSPVDFWPGTIDDIACVIVMAIGYYHHRKAVRRDEERKAERVEEKERHEEERRIQKRREKEEEKRALEERRERQKHEAEMRELEYIEKIVTLNSNAKTANATLCRYCGSVVNSNASYCSHCGTKIEKNQKEHAVMPQFCESCGGPLEPLTEEAVVVCSHCGHKHMLPDYAVIQVEKLRQETQKESDSHRNQILGTFLESRDKQRVLEILISRAGTIIGVAFCILGLTIERFSPLCVVGVLLLFYDVIKSKTQRK